MRFHSTKLALEVKYARLGGGFFSSFFTVLSLEYRANNLGEYMKSSLAICCKKGHPSKEDLSCLVRESIESLGAAAIRDNLQEVLPLSKKYLIIFVNHLNPEDTHKMFEKLSILNKNTLSLGRKTSLTIV